MENEIIINGVTYVKKEDNQKKQSKRGDKYWYICNDGEIEYGHEDRIKTNDDYKALCYPTEAEAIKARDKQLALYRISSYAEEKRGEFVPDRSNRWQGKRYIYYDHNERHYDNSCSLTSETTNLTYFCEKEHCNEIIEKFKDNLDILFDRKGKQ